MPSKKKKNRWKKLLSESRMVKEAKQPGDRHAFEIDLDRIVFSTSFRRLKDKTQVYSLPSNDHVRNRLTHSLEVSSVGRSLGVGVGHHVINKYNLDKLSSYHFGCVVQAACLAHDIGNPPFGHSGENAISEWFKNRSPKGWDSGLTRKQKDDLECFEGNAQGFRILTNIEYAKRKGGLRLTHATLSVFVKYPRNASNNPKDGYIGSKKNGFFQSERKIIDETAKATGMIEIDNGYWKRHPLTYLMEAADDICYSVVDIEDGFELGVISYKDACEILANMANINLKKNFPPIEQIRYLRSIAIGKLIEQAKNVFIENEESILSGEYGKGLLDHFVFVKEAKKLAETIYSSDHVVKKQVSGRNIIHGILDEMFGIVIKLHETNWDISKLDHWERNIAYLIGKNELDVIKSQPTSSKYDAIRFLVDFVSGMTDGFALRLHRQINGIDI
ncbi:MAG: deoxyguanosinetriphosphate triphosphohydrolase [Magnetococcales bacterium]|nr:deoxyguanosinetriphosphate triphosphohydrolase [Magnetococcales bacterium]